MNSSISIFWVLDHKRKTAILYNLSVVTSDGQDGAIHKIKCLKHIKMCSTFSAFVPSSEF